MKVAGTLSGGAPVVKKYQVAASVDNVGVPLLVSAANGAGLAACTTTSTVDMVGINLDTATYVTAQQTDGTSAERTVSMVINPDAIIHARLSGSATEGTALTQFDVTTASTDGLTITTGDAWNSPTYDEGIAWGYDGANAGQQRKITSVDGTSATVTVPFDYDTVVGDNFLRAGVSPMGLQTVQLTTAFQEVDASVAVATNEAEFMVIEVVGNDEGAEGTLTSYVLMVSTDHILSNS